MQLDHYVNTFGLYLKGKYQQRIKKLTLNAAFTCPNRDGTLGKGGCTFCNVDSFNHFKSEQSIVEQLNLGKQELAGKANKYLAYFQAYTSTYQEVEYLKTKYDQALAELNIIGICVGTRPDCLPDEVLMLLKNYADQGFEVWLELGLQSALDKTLKRINRGHDFSAYEKAIERASQYGIKVCTHLIVGLPGEALDESLYSLEKITQLPLQGLKIHPLQIIEGSTLAKAWHANRVKVFSMSEYAAVAGEIIRHTPKEIIYHRVSATANKPMLLAPDWCQLRWPSINEVCRNLDKYGGQGARLSNSSPLELRAT